MHFSASTFQVIKIFYHKFANYFFAYMGPLKFVNLRFNFVFFNRADFQSAKPKLWTFSP